MRKPVLNHHLKENLVMSNSLMRFFGTPEKKTEVNPGDHNVPFTIVVANVGTQDITGIRGQLSLPFGFSPTAGSGPLIEADFNANAGAKLIESTSKTPKNPIILHNTIFWTFFLLIKRFCVDIFDFNFKLFRNFLGFLLLCFSL